MTVPSIVAFAVWFGLAGLTSAIAPDAERLIEAEAERDVLLLDLAEARALPQRAGGFEQRLTETDVAVPPAVDLAGFVRSVDAAGEAAGVFIEQMAPLSVSSDTDDEVITHLPTDTSAVTISIGASGSYDQIMAFADGLRALDRLVVIDRFEANADEENITQVIADLELRIFTTQVLSSPDLEIDLIDEAIDGELDDPGDTPVDDR